MSTLSGGGKANGLTFQNDMTAPAHPCARGICASMHIIRQLFANGWLLGKPDNYNRELALYEEDVLGFVKDTQDSQWQKFCGLFLNNPEQMFLEHVASQYNTTTSTQITGSSLCPMI